MSQLQAALEQGMQPGQDLNEVLGEHGDPGPATEDDARAVAAALRQSMQAGNTAETLHALTALFQAVSDRETAQAMRDHALPALLDVYDHELASLASRGDDQWSRENDLLFVLKILAMYQTREGADRIIAAARRPLQPDGFMWSVIFNSCQAEPQVDYLLESLGSELPLDFIGMAFLDFCNSQFLEGERSEHPFDSPEGISRLRGWLTGDDREEYSYAVSTTAALPFISEPARTELLALAMDHAHTPVQLEAAWASAKLGSDAGIKLLARFAEDVRTSNVARRYLTELGLEEAIPAKANDPDFQATAEMVEWLTHPNEYGEPPDEIELADSRELFWPPTQDRRWVWLFRYTYKPNEYREEEDTGYGMVGSTTFALFGESTADLCPEDVYGLHCCWELEMEDRTAEEGRRMLREANPDAGF